MSDDTIENIDGAPGVQRTERRQDERRKHLRFPLVVEVDAVEPQANARVLGRTSDASQGGCYVDTINPFPVGTLMTIRLTKAGVTFESDAEVRVSQAGMGMGVDFISTGPQHERIFQKWLNELSGKSSPKIDTPEEPSERLPKVATTGNPTAGQDFVLGELLIALMRKGILSEAEGKALLQKLYS